MQHMNVPERICKLSMLRFKTDALSRLLMALFLLSSYGLKAQQTAVQVVSQLAPPYSILLSDYYTGTVPKLFVTLTNRDMLQPVINVRLKMILKRGSSIIAQSNPNGNYRPISLLAGVPVRLSLGDIAEYFTPANLVSNGIINGRLPEGSYEFSFEAYEINTGALVGAAGRCYAFLALSKPPLLNLPLKNAVVAASGTPNIVFTWTPLHLSDPNSAFSTEYEFQLAEVPDNTEPGTTFTRVQPLFTWKIKATAFVYGPADPQLRIGKKYAWRVQARSTNGLDFQDIFENNGVSEVSWFTYTKACPPPVNVTAYWDRSIHRYTVNWMPAITEETRVSFRQVLHLPRNSYGGGSFSYANWQPAVATGNQFRFEFPQNIGFEGLDIEYKLTNVCSAADGILSEYAGRIDCNYNDIQYDNISGNVFMAYSASEQTPTTTIPSLLVSTPGADQSTVESKSTAPGNVLLPLKGIQFTLSFAETNTVIWTGTLNDDGRYSVVRNQAYYGPNINYYGSHSPRHDINWSTYYADLDTKKIAFQFHDPSGVFEDKIVIYNNGISAWKHEEQYYPNYPPNVYYTLPRNIFLIPSFRFRPKVFIPTLPNGAISVDVLLADDSNSHKAIQFMEKMGLGTTQPNALFNGKQYRVLANLTDGRQIKNLFCNNEHFENYVVRLNYGNEPPKYFPMEYISELGDGQVHVIDKYFGIYGNSSISGMVSFKGIPQGNVVVHINVNAADIAEPGNPNTSYDVMTDEEGNYQALLPRLKPGSKIRMHVTVSQIRSLPFKDSLVTTTGVLTKDLVLINNVYTITGRLADQDNNALGNALVSAEGAMESTRTSPQGFYLLKVYGDEPAKVSFYLDGYSVKEKTFTPGSAYNLVSGTSALQAGPWVDALKNTDELRSNAALIPGGLLTAEIMGTGTGSLAGNYPYFFDGNETLKGVIDLGRTTYAIPRGQLALNIPFHGTLVRARVKMDNTMVSKHYDSSSTAGQVFNAMLPAGHYHIEISSLPGDSVFVTYFGEFDIRGQETTTLTVKLTDGVVVRGLVTNTHTHAPVDSVAISLAGTPYTSATDSSGAYYIVLPQNDVFTFHLVQPNYNAKDSLLSTHYDSTYIRENHETFAGHFISFNVDLVPMDRSVPMFTTLSGFPVTIETATVSAPGTYSISGKLTVGDNGIFSAVSSDSKNKLTFKNVIVRNDSTQQNNAEPMADVVFEESVLETKAFTSFPVEVIGKPQIILKGIKEGSVMRWRHGVVGGARLKAKFRSMTSLVKLPVALWDAYLYSNDPTIARADSIRESQGMQPFAYVFSSPNYNITALSPEQTYKMSFLQPDSSYNQVLAGSDSTGFSPADSDFVQSKLLLVKFMVERKTAKLSKSGLALNGYMQFPKIAAGAFDRMLTYQGKREIDTLNRGRVRIRKFTIDKQLRVEQLSLQVTKDSALGLQIGTARLKLTDINIYGLNGTNTDNIGFGFGGLVSILKDTAEKNRDTILINSLFFRRLNSEWMVGASLGTGVRGFSIKSMVFKTEAAQAVTMSYNIGSGSYEMTASGTLDYAANRSSTATSADEGNKGAMKSLFPIEIQSFKLRTKDFAFFLAAKANIKKDLGPASITVDRLLVNIGYGMSVDQMNQYLVQGTTQQQSIGTAGAEDPIDESRASWAIGISGGLEFPINGMDASAGGALIIANVNNSLQIKLDSVYVTLTSPGVKAKASFSLSLNGYRRGFEGKALLTIATRDVEGGLKYYKYTDGGIELGASFKMSGPGGQPIWTTGPIQWYAVGGGFNLNFAEQKYSVFLQGDAGLVGTTKEQSWVQNARLEVLFDVLQCGWKPVIKGSGSLMVRDKQWGTAAMEIDFCKMRLLATVNAEINSEGLRVAVSGVFFAIAPSASSGGAIFFGVNGRANLAGLVEGNVVMALGINYANNDPNAPQEARNMWNDIDAAVKDDNGNKLNGFYLKGSASISSRGGFDVSLKGFSLVSFNYSFYAYQAAAFFVKFNNGHFLLKVEEGVHVEARLSILIVDINALGDARLSLSGGYDGAWWFRGNGSIRVEVYNDEDKSCNSFSIGTRWYVVPYPYFKFCFGINAGFRYRQGEGLQFSLGKGEDE
jgi:hypothetical protein